MGRLNGLQVLRFVAAAMVVHAHALWATDTAGIGTGVFAGIPRAGALGVDLFFVISGAIIYRTAFSGNRPTPGKFLRKRFARIAPLYYVVTLVWLAAASSMGIGFPPRSLLAAVTFWPVWGGFAWAPIAVAWSLSFEMLFYTGAALVLASRRWLWVLWAAYPIAWIVRDLTHAPVANFLGSPIVLEFLAGMLAMRLKDALRLTNFAVWLVLLTATAVVFYVALGMGLPAAFYDARAVVEGDMALPRAAICTVPFAVIVWCALQFEGKARWLKPLIFLGDASYSIYLVHWVLFAALIPFLASSAPATFTIFGLMDVGLIAGCIVYRVLERPLLSAVRGRLSPSASAAPRPRLAP